MRGVEAGTSLPALYPAQFVVFEMGCACPLVGTVGQVAGTTLAIAAVDGLS